MPGVLRLVLGDQISDGRLSSLRDLDAKRDTVLFAEVGDETGLRQASQAEDRPGLRRHARLRRALTEGKGEGALRRLRGCR